MEIVKTARTSAETLAKGTGKLGRKLYKFVHDNEVFWMVTAFFMTGVVIGMIFSPHRDISIGSNNSGNGCNNTADGCKAGCCDDEE
ncbi:hypothetical protein SAMN02910447_03633 [Ruminococcus sp. YE71]|uniref:hypothetical protein n=1 Tax=unclassified Ruminococcus TaxID=2608920 RepID=UPI00088D45F9|nr:MULTISPECIES: hypothetical protein [unclassified Ruminococcus]SDA32948.1 hypothetical protein SAMN02910446_03685 [Ruminococcus sp. YE78]SFW54677.1 hypothetical protein SAMN02910447_03633 [Ruminococcus sp. YE71]